MEYSGRHFSAAAHLQKPTPRNTAHIERALLPEEAGAPYEGRHTQEVAEQELGVEPGAGGARLLGRFAATFAPVRALCLLGAQDDLAGGDAAEGQPWRQAGTREDRVRLFAMCKGLGGAAVRPKVPPGYILRHRPGNSAALAAFPPLPAAALRRREVLGQILLRGGLAAHPREAAIPEACAIPRSDDRLGGRLRQQRRRWRLQCAASRVAEAI
mmetsp:Transcript_63259/g.183272  ORF Transcript_63259/g.183272 Transcript_63259/m.183272 type:complete len:213 (-) Transcript_63259:502-1140(-)